MPVGRARQRRRARPLAPGWRSKTCTVQPGQHAAEDRQVRAALDPGADDRRSRGASSRAAAPSSGRSATHAADRGRSLGGDRRRRRAIAIGTPVPGSLSDDDGVDRGQAQRAVRARSPATHFMPDEVARRRRRRGGAPASHGRTSRRARVDRDLRRQLARRRGARARSSSARRAGAAPRAAASPRPRPRRRTSAAAAGPRCDRRPATRHRGAL